MVRLGAADADLGEARSGGIDRDARHFVQRVLYAADTALFDLLGGQHGMGAAVGIGHDGGEPARKQDRVEGDGIGRLLCQGAKGRERGAKRDA